MSFLLEYSSLELLETIKEYDYFNRALLFSCRNSAGEIFLAVWVHETEDFELYLCVPISQQRLTEVETGALDVRDAFKKAELGLVYEVKIPHENSPDMIETIPCEKLREECLPKAGYLLKSDAKTPPVLTK
ncbi:DUF6575 domain-containing protein [Argonema galeatum]|uniref:DUF6575 domain-containing protein n=1 Tax=Argonema galeatum TaxID=2942762 RepID=UPI0020123FD1|nr:DUF6575 domain-containing protein [Argonema galeatum]MCL1468176.1 hypothetical protein [Argonema galeatum A003/A1]